MRIILLALFMLTSMITAESNCFFSVFKHTSTAFQDKKELSLNDLYEETMLCREHYINGLTRDCLRTCDEALHEYSGFPGADRYIGYLYSYKGLCNKRLGRLELARSLLSTTRYYAIQQKDELLEISNNINLATLENDCQNYNKAKRILEDCLNHSDIDSFYSLKEVTLSNLAKTCVSVGEFQAAEEYYSELFNRIRGNDLGGELDLPLLYRNYGSFLQMKGDIIIAIDFYKNALAKYSGKFSAKHFQHGNTYRYLAEAYLETDSIRRAMECYDQSVKVLRGVSADENNPGNYDLVSYETVFLQAISSYAACIHKLILEQEELASLKRAEQAVKMVEEAEGRINSFVRTQPPGFSVFILAGKVRPLFDAGIQCAMYLFDQTGNDLWLQQAFEWSVRSKAYSLRIQADKKKMIYNEPGAGDLFAKQKDLLHSIHSPSIADNQYSEENIKALAATVNEYELVTDSLEKLTARLSDGDSTQENLIRKSKSWKQSLISYHLCRETAFVFILNKGRLDFESFEVSEDLSEFIKRLKTILFTSRDAFYNETEVIEFEKIGNQLYNRLLSPIIKKAGTHSIIVQPDGILLGLPFELLIGELQPPGVELLTFRDLDYLMNDYEISYWMGLEIERSDQYKKSKKSLLVSCLDNSDERGMFAETSLEGIRALFTDIQQVDNYISSVNLDSYKYFHFASHYGMNIGSPLKSGLVCSQDFGITYLTLDEILSGSFSESHVFINGCNSGSGSLNPGQGLTSMALVFGISGADEVIAHLWKAEDKVSENLALKFYQKGIPANYSKRLNRIMKEYLKESPTGFDHPHFWGGIVCSGKPTKKSPGYWWVITVIFICAIMLLKRKR